jgi:hypothetical protein
MGKTQALYQVPEEAVNFVLDKLWGVIPSAKDIETILNLFAQWQAEHGKVPTDAQCNQLVEAKNYNCLKVHSDYQIIALQWQRIMYLVPPDPLEELLTWPKGCIAANVDEANKRIAAAHALGVQRGKEFK